MNSTMLDLILLMIAFVCFLRAAVRPTTRVNLVGVGLAAWVLVPLLHTLHTLR